MFQAGYSYLQKWYSLSSNLKLFQQLLSVHIQIGHYVPLILHGVNAVDHLYCQCVLLTSCVLQQGHHHGHNNNNGLPVLVYSVDSKPNIPNIFGLFGFTL